MEEDKTKSVARIVAGCQAYEEVISECVNGNQHYIYTWARGILKIHMKLEIAFKNYSQYL